MKRAFALVTIALAGCASTPQTPKPSPPTFEQVGIREVQAPTPGCQAGHDNALIDGTIIIEPGQTLCIALKLRGARVIPARVVDKADPGRTLIVRFWQEPGTHDTYLSLHSPLGLNLRYRARMRRPDAYRYERTSTCDVPSHRMAIEHWPYTIAALSLSGFEGVPATDNIRCD